MVANVETASALAWTATRSCLLPCRSPVHHAHAWEMILRPCGVQVEMETRVRVTPRQEGPVRMARTCLVGSVVVAVAGMVGERRFGSGFCLLNAVVNDYRPPRARNLCAYHYLDTLEHRNCPIRVYWVTPPQSFAITCIITCFYERTYIPGHIPILLSGVLFCVNTVILVTLHSPP
ncbi:hypothetical protein EDC04DRAFT_2727213 [Pisolithus marmoratus]|nr:hypothetical protein EDC04DRAFT_2727213 [Pisolithus marmoratus]